MLKKAVPALVLVTLLFASAQADDYVTPAEAQEVAQELINRIVSYVSALPEKAQDLPELRGGKLEDPILVHRYSDLKPCYYVVPVVGAGGRITCLIGTSAEKKDWQWFTRTQLESFSQVSKSQAYDICAQTATSVEVSQPRVVEMPNKKMYWLCLTHESEPMEILVSIDNASEVHTSLDPDFSDLTIHSGPVPSAGERRESPSQKTPERAPAYPDDYNIEDVPFYYQETSWYCGEASLEMIFDYWGPDICQDDIGDVANDSILVGTRTDDMRRTPHFSYISTAIQNPFLQGFDERDLGYSSNEVWWSHSDHFPDRYDDLKNLISNDYPIVIVTWYSSSHSSGHYRVLKGYDDWLNHFIVHDPWYTLPYSGPDLHFNQQFLVDDLWELVDRWGLFSAPWFVDITVDSLVGVDQLFTLNVEFTYTAFHPFENQFMAQEVQATIDLPSGYQLIDPPSSTVSFGTQYSGFVGDTSWTVQAASDSSGPDTIRVEVKGKIHAECYSYQLYEDWIGGQAAAVITTIPYTCGDTNEDNLVDLGDVVYLLTYLYRNGSAPSPIAAGDVNVDSAVDIADVVYLLNYLFKDGPAPCE